MAEVTDAEDSCRKVVCCGCCCCIVNAVSGPAEEATVPAGLIIVFPSGVDVVRTGGLGAARITGFPSGP